MRLKIIVSGLAALCAAWAVASAEKPPTSSPFIGTDKCRMCHPDQHKTWAASRHARAMDSLTAAEKKDPECFRCHVTGYGGPGGYVSLDRTPGLANVGCEACHGGGSVHMAAPMEDKKKTISTNGLDCRTCHHPHVDATRKRK